MSESNKKWYVLRAAGGKEKKAKEYLEKEIERRSLQDLVSQVLVPTEKVYKIRDGKRICTERLFYPGYVLIEAELTGELQHIIRNEIPHMSGFLTEKRTVSTSAFACSSCSPRILLASSALSGTGSFSSIFFPF